MRATSKPILCGCLLALFGFTNRADAFSYSFADVVGDPDSITFMYGYFGAGGPLPIITVGIDPTSMHAASMVVSTQNVIRTWNALVGGNGNLLTGGANNILPGEVDFESTLLHEMGHALGLGHNNLSTESGVAATDRDYAKSLPAAGGYNLDPGGDGIIGTNDDVRGDDINLNYFKMDTNNPFEIATVVDSTTYSRDLADLPVGHNYSAVASRQVAGVIGGGVPTNTEAVLNQGQFSDEAQRTLGFDDVAGIRYAMAGLDGIAGNGDDYTFQLSYAGLTTNATIVIDFDDAETGFAEANTSAFIFGANDHASLASGTDIYFRNSGTTWFFNQVSNETVPEPSALLLSLVAGAGCVMRRRRKKPSVESHSSVC